jgi:hypothetical protein
MPLVSRSVGGGVEGPKKTQRTRETRTEMFQTSATDWVPSIDGEMVTKKEVSIYINRRLHILLPEKPTTNEVSIATKVSTMSFFILLACTRR